MTATTLTATKHTTTTTRSTDGADGPDGPDGTRGLVGQVTAHLLEDGLVVRLSGVPDAQTVHALRTALLRGLPVGCTDVLVDAGAAQSLPDEAVAVFVAAAAWCRAGGRRFGISSMSAEVGLVLSGVGLFDELRAC